ncbi:MAG: hypothetical protein RJA70_2514 [Pseudomonadota bacterium]
MKYLGTQFKVATVDTETGNSTQDVANVTYLTPQVTVGYQWDWQPFSLRLGGGLEYSIGELSSDFSDQEVDFSGMDVELDAAVGVTF